VIEIFIQQTNISAVAINSWSTSTDHGST